MPQWLLPLLDGGLNKGPDILWLVSAEYAPQKVTANFGSRLCPVGRDVLVALKIVETLIKGKGCRKLSHLLYLALLGLEFCECFFVPNYNVEDILIVDKLLLRNEQATC